MEILLATHKVNKNAKPDNKKEITAVSNIGCYNNED